MFIEVLDYHTGQFWLFDGASGSAVSRDYLKTRKPFYHIEMSEMETVAVATAFPIIFQGKTAYYSHDKDRPVQLQDAGLVDNLAMMPLLEILRHERHGGPLGTVEQWILSNAGTPLAVTSTYSSAFLPGGHGKFTKKLGLIDRFFRLTGDLAQPQFVRSITDVLRDYASVDSIGLAIGTTTAQDMPWIAAMEGDPTPAEMVTALGFVRQDFAIRVIAEGAQATSKALKLRGMITAEQEIKLKTYIVGLERQIPFKPSGNKWLPWHWPNLLRQRSSPTGPAG